MNNHRIALKDNIIYFKLGLLLANDFEQINLQVQEILSKNAKPEYGIVDFKRLIETDSLVHPEDWQALQDLINIGKGLGITKSFWIIPEESLLFKTLKNKLDLPNHLVIVESAEEAEREISKINQ